MESAQVYILFRMCPVVCYWVQWRSQLRCRSCSGCVLTSAAEYSDKVNSRCRSYSSCVLSSATAWVLWWSQLRCIFCSGCVLSSATEYSDEVNSGVDLVPDVSWRLLLNTVTRSTQGVDLIPTVSCRLLLSKWQGQLRCRSCSGCVLLSATVWVLW